jgi:hypothetical protein
MNRRRWITCLILIAPALACTVLSPGTPSVTPGTASPTETPGGTPIPDESPAPIPPLTAEMLRNATFHLPETGETVTFADGRYDGGTEPNVIHARLLEPFAFSDLNGDGALDAAVVLSENTGGSGTFVSLVAVLNDLGYPLQSHDVFIDDRPMVNGYAASGRRITLDAVVHASIDPLCCPSFPTVQTWEWSPDRLTLVRLTSRTPTDAVRSIEITAPAPGSSAGGTVAVQAAVTIAPFENTLVYLFYGPGEDLLTEGPVMVDSEDVGEPGTVDASLPVPAVPTGTRLRLTLLDLSAMDGSVLAMDSIVLVAE